MLRLAALSIMTALVIAPAASASHISHYHSGVVTNIGGTACDVTWEHVLYTSNYGYGETVEVSPYQCFEVQVIMNWYKEGIGNVTSAGPVQNNISTINSTIVLNINWQKACGNAACNQYL